MVKKIVNTASENTMSRIASTVKNTLVGHQSIMLVAQKLFNSAQVIPKSVRKNIIAVKSLSKSFGDKKVINNLSFSIKEGSSTVILGLSGSGKSVLIKMIVGLLQPDAGEIQYKGGNTAGFSEKEHKSFMKDCGFLFQGGALFDSLNIWQNICFYLLENEQISEEDAKAKAAEKLAEVGLKPEIMDMYPSQISGGMQKRVALARAICNNPKIVFLDEPTTGLDPIMANVINELIVKIHKKFKTTMVTITHDMNSMKKIASDVAMLYKGEIIWYNKAKHLPEADNPLLKQLMNGKTKGPIDI